MRNGKLMLAFMVVVLGLALTACGGKDYKPVAIKEGVDKCEVCQMLIKDDQYATEIILKDQKPLKFDDIGDLFVWLKKNGRDNVGAIYVRDYKTKEWLELDKATYVYDASAKTPMSFGVLSFKSEADADAYIKEKGTGKKMMAKDLDSHSWEHAGGGMHKQEMGGQGSTK
ncbi:nitrous oxide reductase accessory protein NosL [Gorillibacterium sp. sgz5001074]|uniref:nitrous oxide reductase accessory protein NosL n=1 Tax=Gorillibacterium sp. sgz5001074 TaxID=3446695 RepID=UPI003F67A162